MILTNQWTEHPHGHAQSELSLLKALLVSKGFLPEILSSHSSFGDFHIGSKAISSYIPSKFLRGPIYHYAINGNEKKFAKNIAQALNQRPAASSVIISSGFWSQLIHTLSRKEIRSLHFRLISPPEEKSVAKSDLDLVRNALKTGRLKLAIETLDGLEYLEEIFEIQSFHVPPLTTVSNRNEQSTKVGIFWSVTDSVSTSDIQKIINYFSKEELLIKLPVGIESDLLEINAPNIEIIPNGISNHQFAHEIGRLDIAYLPHKNYFKRGSGLITSMLGSGVIVMAHKENSFIKDFEFSNLLKILSEEDLQSQISEILSRKFLNVNRPQEAHKVNNYILTNWEEFLHSLEE